VSKDGGTKESGEDGDDDDLKPRKRVAISRGKPPSKRTNLVQLSEDGGAKEAKADGDDDNLKPRKRMAASRTARGKQNKDATSAHTRKTGKIAGAKKTPSIEHGSKNNVKTVEPHEATSNDDHDDAAVHRVSDHGVTRTSSRKKTKPVKYQ
jgi:formamidopyrimidine-DNA glycosylase